MFEGTDFFSCQGDEFPAFGGGLRCSYLNVRCAVQFHEFDNDTQIFLEVAVAWRFPVPQEYAYSYRC